MKLKATLIDHYIHVILSVLGFAQLLSCGRNDTFSVYRYFLYLSVAFLLVNDERA